MWQILTSVCPLLPFSLRFVLLQMQGAVGASYDSLIAKLPADAKDVYYRDRIGTMPESTFSLCCVFSSSCFFFFLFVQIDPLACPYGNRPTHHSLPGNITTSSLRYSLDAATLELKPRFPIFGGWKTSW